VTVSAARHRHTAVRNAQLAEAALARDDAAEALELARGIEAHDPMDELGCALAIRALRLTGDEVGVERS